jgi:hypothetical protein
MIGIAAARFVMTAKTCAREQDRESTSHLRGCWFFWAASLFLYLSHALVTKL